MNENSKHRKRKRRDEVDREKLKQYGVDLPEIPGIPVQIIPLYVHAVKVTAKYFQHVAHDKSVPPYDTASQLSDNNNNNNNDNNNYNHEFHYSNKNEAVTKSVLDTVLDRIDKVSAQTNDATTEAKEKNEIRNKKFKAIESWMDAVRRWVKDDASRHNASSSTDDMPRKKPSVPVAIMDHLLETIMEHKRIAVRRSAIHLLGHILEKSSDCRKCFFDSSNNNFGPPLKYTLLEWTSNAFEFPNSLADESDEQKKLVRLLQQEMYLVLQHMENSGYSDLYPTISVSIQRFQQFCPEVVILNPSSGGTDTAFNNEGEQRRIRDIAIQFYEKEYNHVTKLIEQAYKYMDILVPRFGDDVTNPKVDIESSNVVVSSNDSDDEDIDWEDGNEDTSHDMVEGEKINSTSHVDAVEYTLSVMKSTGGLQNGALEIDFEEARSSQGPLGVNNNNNRQQTNEIFSNAEKRLRKIIKTLSNRHMLRLSDWVECLSTADNLVAVTADGKISFISLSTSQGMRRKEALTQLSELKRNVASVLQSAARLNIELSDGRKVESSNSSAPIRNPNIIFNRGISATLTTRINARGGGGFSRPGMTKRSSNRIEIKVRKSS